MKYTIVIIMLFSCCNAIADTDYCHDQSVNAKWQRMIKKYPEDAIVLHLAALREGLCSMIDRGEISKDTAIDIFESAKGAAIQQRFTDETTSIRDDKLSI